MAWNQGTKDQHQPVARKVHHGLLGKLWPYFVLIDPKELETTCLLSLLPNIWFVDFPQNLTVERNIFPTVICYCTVSWQ